MNPPKITRTKNWEMKGVQYFFLKFSSICHSIHHSGYAHVVNFSKIIIAKTRNDIWILIHLPFDVNLPLINITSKNARILLNWRCWFFASSVNLFIQLRTYNLNGFEIKKKQSKQEKYFLHLSVFAYLFKLIIYHWIA